MRVHIDVSTGQKNHHRPVHLDLAGEQRGDADCTGAFDDLAFLRVGVTDAGGVYSLKLMGNDQAGAVVGKHRVEINLVVASDDRDPRTRPPTKTLPAKYNRNSELNFEVPAGGTDQANFELKEK